MDRAKFADLSVCLVRSIKIDRKNSLVSSPEILGVRKRNISLFMGEIEAKFKLKFQYFSELQSEKSLVPENKISTINDFGGRPVWKSIKTKVIFCCALISSVSFCKHKTTTNVRKVSTDNFCQYYLTVLQEVFRHI